MYQIEESKSLIAIPNLLTTAASTNWFQRLALLVRIAYGTIATWDGELTTWTSSHWHQYGIRLVQDIYEMAKEEGTEIGLSGSKASLTPVKGETEEGWSRKSLIPQHSTEKVSARLKGSLWVLEEFRMGEE